MNKKLEKFYKSIESIVLFPGSLAELNKQEKARDSGIIYGFLPKKSPRYIRGTLFPTRKDFETYAHAASVIDKLLQNDIATGMKQKLQVYMGPLIFEADQLGSLTEKNIEDTLKMYPQDLLDLDVRLQAKKIGAQGLVYLQLVDTQIYQGMPVRQI